MSVRDTASSRHNDDVDQHGTPQSAGRPWLADDRGDLNTQQAIIIAAVTLISIAAAGLMLTHMESLISALNYDFTSR